MKVNDFENNIICVKVHIINLRTEFENFLNHYFEIYIINSKTITKVEIENGII